MNEIKEPRSMQEIEKEYGQNAARLGDLDYKMHCFKEEKLQLVQNMSNLNKEALERKKLDDIPSEPLKVVEPEVVA